MVRVKTTWKSKASYVGKFELSVSEAYDICKKYYMENIDFVLSFEDPKHHERLLDNIKETFEISSGFVGSMDDHTILTIDIEDCDVVPYGSGNEDRYGFRYNTDKYVENRKFEFLLRIRLEGIVPDDLADVLMI